MKFDNFSAVILKGGKSSRMGEDKSMLPIDGKPMIVRLYDILSKMTDTVMVSLAKGETAAFTEMIGVEDLEADKGPLMGICSALFASKTDRNLVVACDIPYVDVGIVEQLLSFSDAYAIVIPSFQEGRLEPLFGVYRKEVAPVARQLLSEGATRVSALFDKCATKVLHLTDSGWYHNINTRGDYERAICRR